MPSGERLGASRPLLARLGLGAVLPITLLGTAVLVPLTTWSHLPDQMAVHFGTSGAGNGTLSRLGVLLLVTALTAIPGGWLSWAMFLRRSSGWSVQGRAAPIRIGIGIAAFTAGLGPALAVSLVIANYDAVYWELATIPSYGVAVILGIPCVLGLVAYLLSPGCIANRDE